VEHAANLVAELRRSCGGEPTVRLTGGRASAQQ
jgi:hypothetical protein